MSSPRLQFRQVDRDRWDDLAALFEARGGPKSCWCMVWRQTAAEAKHRDGNSRRAALRSRVMRGLPVGILGYWHGTPVAWCSIAPRATYRDLGGAEDFADNSNAVWSLVCFYIKRELRGQSLTDQLLEAAVAHARRHGAKVVEAYPVDPDSPSYRFMGFVSVFQRAGFRKIGTAANGAASCAWSLPDRDEGEAERPDARGRTRGHPGFAASLKWARCDAAGTGASGRASARKHRPARRAARYRGRPAPPRG
jgi:GNAT superfamily N-acetyltransferase